MFYRFPEGNYHIFAYEDIFDLLKKIVNIMINQYWMNMLQIDELNVFLDNKNQMGTL